MTYNKLEPWSCSPWHSFFAPFGSVIHRDHDFWKPYGSWGSVMTLEKASVDQRYYRVTSISLMVNSHINDAWINTHSHNFASLAPKLRRLGQRNLRMWKRGAPHWWLRSCQADNGQSHLLVMSNPGVAPDQTTHKFSSGEYIPYIIIYGFALNDECVIPWSTPGWVMFIHIYIHIYMHIIIYIYICNYHIMFIYTLYIALTFLAAAQISGRVLGWRSLSTVSEFRRNSWWNQNRNGENSWELPSGYD